ncbi:uncharacterized protein [Nicotiana sylvestris]|uniref:uncharacterized protein n=1 Tax=Nicotiana sylvestris TaxID=4096 RepID=UPI00388C9FF9
MAGQELDASVIDPSRDGEESDVNLKEEIHKLKHQMAEIDNPVQVKKAVTEEEVEEFLRKIKVKDYSIVEQLRKTHAQISLLSLLIHSEEHCRALMKILNEFYVPDKISVNHLEKIANKIFEVNRVTFSDDELPVEGTEHNKALYLTVKCEDSMVTRVSVDNGSSSNICPLSTLNKLKADDERIHKNNICVRGFDDRGKDSVGDIVLELTIGPVEFTMEFQVLDVAVSYNLLLGRPCIHAAKAVPSTLHQMVKLEWDRQDIVGHSEDNLCAHSDASIPFIEAEDDKGPWVYQVFETTPIEKVLEGKCVPTPKIASASIMMASEMLKNGFMPGKGLGRSLQGIIQPVSLRENLGTSGLGFKPTATDLKRDKRLKQKAWALPKPILRLSRSFVKPGARKRPMTIIPSSVVNIGEGSNKANVQFVGPNVKLNNWKATPLPTLSFYAGFNDMTRMTNLRPSLKSQSNSEIIIQEIECENESEYDEDEDFEEISKELSHFEEKPNPNLNNTEAINLGDPDNDIFAWSYDDMPSLSTDLVVHKFPNDPAFPPVKQKLRKFKTNMSVKIKEEITKQLDAKVIRVTRYPTWLTNVVPMTKKDEFIVSRRGIELDQSNIKAIQELPPPKNKTELLKKDSAVKWTDECQEAFDKIKKYLSNPPHEITDKKEQVIYYLSKKFTSYEVKYTPLERTCCALTWVAQKLKHYLSSYTTCLISRLDPLNDESPSFSRSLGRESVDEEYEPLRTYFHDEEVMHIDEVEKDEKPGWKLFFDGAANIKGVRIGVMLISETGHHYPVTA